MTQPDRATDQSKILFYDEKKSVIVNILDTAAKTFDFDQPSYMQAKSQLLNIIEAPGNERIGLDKVVILTNKLISKVAQNSGYIIVESAKGELAKDDLIVDDAVPGAGSSKAARSPADDHSAGHAKTLHRPQVSSEKRTAAQQGQEPNIKGKESLLRLMNFLPPLIPRQEIALLTAQVKTARIGPPSGSQLARTTGDLEQGMVDQLREKYGHVFRGFVKEKPQAFIETIEMASGGTREEDVSGKLREKLSRVNSVAAFLSFRDLVERQLKDYDQAHRKTDEKTKKSMFFWRKT